MSKMITVQVSDYVYELLLNKATEMGQTPEQIALMWLEDKTKQIDNEPLLQLAGIFSSDVPNISAQHDKYIGEHLHHEEQ